MAGIRIHCAVKQYPEVIRVMDIPDEMTFEDLRLVLNAAFDLNSADEHLFGVGEHNIAICEDDEEKLRCEHEGDIMIRKLLSEKQKITYRVSFDNEILDIAVTMDRALTSYALRRVSVGKAEGVIPKDCSILEKKDSDAPNAAELTRILSKVRLRMNGNSEPNYDEISSDYLEHLDSLLNNSYLGKALEKMRQGELDKTYYPKAPKVEERGPAYKNEAELLKFFKEHPGEELKVVVGKKTVAELQIRLDSLGLFDVCKYLQLIKMLEKSDKEKAKAISDALYGEPELLFYTLTPEQQEGLLSLPALAESGQPYTGPDLSTSVFHCVVEFDSKKKTLILAKDLPDILSILTKKDLDKLNKRIEEFDKYFSLLMMYYSIIDIDEVPELLKRNFDYTISKRECTRLIYWKYSTTTIYRTGTVDVMGQYSFVFQPYINPKEMLPRQALVEIMVPYADMLNVENWIRDRDFMHCLPGWSYANAMFVLNMRLTEEESRERCTMLYYDILNGMKMKELMGEIYDMEKQPEIIIRFQVWEICLRLLLGTPLPFTKGERRAKACQDPSYFMTMCNFVENPVDEKDIKADTRIEDLPQDIQLELGLRFLSIEEKDLPHMLKIVNKYSHCAEINFLMGTAYARLEDLDEALKYYKRCEKIMAGRDRSMEDVVLMCEKGNIIKMPTLLDGTFMYL